MFEKIKDALSLLREYLVLSEKVEQDKREIAKLRADYDKLEEKFERLVLAVEKSFGQHLEQIKEEVRNVCEKEAANRKIALLELENKFLKTGKSLPSGKEKK